MEISAVDLFCGAGGSSTGLIEACDELGVKLQLLAINHWDVAIKTHTKNHPWARHICEALDTVDPYKVVDRLDLLIASPECRWHSRARGGKPINDQLRASAWHVPRWIEAHKPAAVLLENVREFRDWGPVDSKGKPIKSRKGETYQAFLNAIRALGYTVEDRVLNAADYGDATTRERLFIIAKRGEAKIEWPLPTHSRAEWRPAREVIDWGLKGTSIFNRKRPLAPATMRRILAGLEKFGGPDLQPFLVVLRNHADGRSVDAPLPTLTAGGTHVGVAEPFLVTAHHGTDKREGDGQYGRRAKSLKEPVPTLTGSNSWALVEPFIVPFFGERDGQEPRTHSVDQPLPAVTSHGAGAVVEPFILPHRQFDRMDVDSVEKPLRTFTAKGGTDFALVQPFIVPIDQQSAPDGTKGVDIPLGTVTTKARFAVAEPFITEYYGTQKIAHSVNKPLNTITTKERFALVMPVVNGRRLDIRFRMLKKHELAAAMSFPDGYEFAGNEGDAVKQIGNAVAVKTAKALLKTILGGVEELEEEKAA